MTDERGERARDDQHAMDGVIERLTSRYPTVDPSHVTEIVQDEAGKLAGGKVRDFIPVLVEHAANDRLRQEADPVPMEVPAEQQRLAPTDEPQELDPMEVEERKRHTGLLLGDIDQ